MKKPKLVAIDVIAALVLAAILLLIVQAFSPAPTNSNSVDAAKIKEAKSGEWAAYKSANGPFRTESQAALALYDSKRGKDIRLRVTWPDAPGRFPVIVFSHGAGGSQDGYLPLTEFWAQHGYVVIQPSHADSIKLARSRGQKLKMREVLGKIDKDVESWENRAADISFILDTLPEMERKIPALSEKLDSASIGLGGHSFGAFTTEIVGGATVTTPSGERKSFLDERPDALLVLSGQGTGQMGLTEDSFAGIDRPMMHVTGSLDSALKGQPPEWRKEMYDGCPPGNKFWVWIDGAYHMSFAGRLAGGDFRKLDLFDKLMVLGREKDIDAERGMANAAGERRSLKELLQNTPDLSSQPAIFECVKTVSLAFWDAYLKNSGSAKKWLAGDAAGKTANDLFIIESK